MRPRGGIIGLNLAPTTTAASGVWTLREAESLRRAGTWPRGPIAPTALSATAGNAQLSLSWTAPATTHGTITNYLVEYTPSAGSAAYVLTGSTSTSYTLTGLTNGTAYTVRVAAVNFTAGDYSGTATGTPAAGAVLARVSGDTVSGGGTLASPFTKTFYYGVSIVFSVTGSGTLYYSIKERSDTGDFNLATVAWQRGGTNISGHAFNLTALQTKTGSFSVSGENISLVCTDVVEIISIYTV